VRAQANTVVRRIEGRSGLRLKSLQPLTFAVSPQAIGGEAVGKGTDEYQRASHCVNNALGLGATVKNCSEVIVNND